MNYAVKKSKIGIYVLKQKILPYKESISAFCANI